MNTGIGRLSPVYLNNPQTFSATYTNITLKIVDSGAEVTLIDRALAKRLNLKISKMDSNIRYIAANNETIEHDGFTILSIEIGKWKTKQKAIVIRKLSTDLLLGTDWLQHNGVILNYQKCMLSCGKFYSPLLTTKTQITHCIHTNKSITIAACSSHVEWINVPDSLNGTAYLENENPIRYLNVRDGLFTIKNSQVPIILLNKNTFEVHVGKGKFIGTLEKMDDVKILNGKCSPNPHDYNLSGILNYDKRLTTVQKHGIQQLAGQYNKIFSKSDNDLGYYTKTEFDIQTGDHRPIKCHIEFLMLNKIQ
jgi:hypothetical protein